MTLDRDAARTWTARLSFAGAIVLGVAALIVASERYRHTEAAVRLTGVDISAILISGQELALENFGWPTAHAASADGSVLTGILAQMSAERLVLDAPRFRFDASNSTLQDLEAVLSQAISGLVAPQWRSIVIEGGTVELTLKGAQDPLLLTGLALSLQLGGEGDAISGQASFDVDGKQGTASFSALRPEAGAASSARTMSFQLDAGGFSTRFTGTALIAERPTADGRLRLRAEDGATLLALADLDRLVGPFVQAPAPFSFVGDLSYRGRRFAVENAEIAHGVNTAQGYLSVDFSKDKPKYDATLALDRVLLEPPGDNHAEVLAQVGGLLRQAPADMLADLRLSLSRLQIGQFQSGGAAISISLRPGKVLADVAELVLADGIVRGQLDLTLPVGNGLSQAGTAGSAPTSLTVRAEGKDIDLGRAALPFLAMRPVTGIGSVNLTLSSQAPDITKLLGAMTGQVELMVSGGGSIGLDLARIVEHARG